MTPAPALCGMLMRGMSVVGWNHQQAATPLMIPPKIAMMFVVKTMFETVETATRVPPNMDVIFECGFRHKG